MPAPLLPSDGAGAGHGRDRRGEHRRGARGTDNERLERKAGPGTDCGARDRWSRVEAERLGEMFPAVDLEVHGVPAPYPGRAADHGHHPVRGEPCRPHGSLLPGSGTDRRCGRSPLLCGISIDSGRPYPDTGSRVGIDVPPVAVRQHEWTVDRRHELTTRRVRLRQGLETVRPKSISRRRSTNYRYLDQDTTLSLVAP